MTQLEVLRTARELFLAGKHRALGMVLIEDLLLAAAEGDRNLVDDALCALDACTPKPWTFGMYLDGAEAVSDGETVNFVYRYNRKPEEVAAVFGKACVIAARVVREVMA